MKYLRALRSLLDLALQSLSFRRLCELIGQVMERCRRWHRLKQLPGRMHKTAPGPCVPVSDPAYKRPDPLIYSQFYLMKQGLAVTWNNPDIELRHNGVPIDSHQLEPDTEYDVVARIWNGSTEAPVVGLPVQMSYLSFGAGTVSHPIGKTHVNLGVKGGPNHPAFATVPWKTPATAGHYCIQVRFAWADDLNPNNNLGQENTDVGTAHSPAEFHFQLRNDTRRQQRYHFETDAYRIPPRGPCAKRPPRREPPPRQEPGTINFVPPEHQRANHPLPQGWKVDFEPAIPTLAPGDEATIRVLITPPDTFHGSQPVNVHAFHSAGLAGGVTLTVERT